MRLTLGGRAAANFAGRLVVPVSNDTLLRIVRRRAHVSAAPLCIIGIDDWAWRRNHRYGKVACDLERRRPMILLPEREPPTAETWPAGKPGIVIVARDRGGGYGETVAKALPNAFQIAGRWRLMQNASRAFLNAVRKSVRHITSTASSERPQSALASHLR